MTHNAAVVHLLRSEENDPLSARLLEAVGLSAAALQEERLAQGLVALYYRARPKVDPAGRWNRSFVGLALFTPTLELLGRAPEPMLAPAEAPEVYDGLGVEDPRITRIGDTFYLVYAGIARKGKRGWRSAVCMARSTDLVTWEKLGPVPGNVNTGNNKDGVLFPEPVDGRYYLLHRPMVGSPCAYEMALAASDSPLGPWEDCGNVLRAYENPSCAYSWVGAGSVPVPLGGGRFLVLYHTGNWLDRGRTRREYDLDAAIFDLTRMDDVHPERVVESRLEHLMVPETSWEIEAPYPDSVGNVLFSCGHYEHEDCIYIVYGGGDTYLMAARLNKEALLACLAGCNTCNPFLQPSLAAPVEPVATPVEPVLA